MLLPQHNYEKPASLDECLEALRDAGESPTGSGLLVAGGTDVIFNMRLKLYEECETDDGQFLNPSRLEYKMRRTYEMMAAHR